MECFWVFSIIALLPLVCPKILPVATYVSSSYLQLVALPLLGVAAGIIGKVAEIRAQQDHEALIEELEILKDMHKEVQELLTLLHGKLDNL